MKRQQENIAVCNDDNKNQKFQRTTIDASCSSVTQFEHLSNEIFYEIFEYLDFYYIHQAFSNLNQRFQNLLNDSKLCIEIDSSPVSKSNFEDYFTNIIMPNIHRIRSFRLSFLCSTNMSLLSQDNISIFTRLETLVLDNIEPSYMSNLHHFKTLPKLFSLVIFNNDHAYDPDEIYRQIFQLPVLRYCKVSLKESSRPTTSPLPFATNIYTSIEQLVIDYSIHIDSLYAILSYVPQLRYLSIHILTGSSKKRWNAFINEFNYFTHIYIRFCVLSFDDFELLAENVFRNLLVLCFYTSGSRTYLDADRWQYLISFRMPNLKIFDIQYMYPVGPDYETMINKFTSSFWIERQWFFATQYPCGRDQKNAIFYSTKPYRRKIFVLREIMEEKNNLDSVHDLYIESIQAMINCKCHFPNATKLTLNSYLNTINDSIGNNLTRIISLKQITTLSVHYHSFSLIQLIELLNLIENVQTLNLSFLSFDGIDPDATRQSIHFQLASERNIVKKLIVSRGLTLERTELLTALCPRLEHLTIDGRTNSLVPTIRLLLSNNNPNTGHLSYLCVRGVQKASTESLTMMIEREKLRDNYSMKLVNQQLYLWW